MARLPPLGKAPQRQGGAVQIARAPLGYVHRRHMFVECGDKTFHRCPSFRFEQPSRDGLGLFDERPFLGIDYAGHSTGPDMDATVRPNSSRCCLLCFHSAPPPPANTGPFTRLRQALVSPIQRDTGREAGAAVIAFDIDFAEPDRTSPKLLLRLLAQKGLAGRKHLYR